MISLFCNYRNNLEKADKNSCISDPALCEVLYDQDIEAIEGRLKYLNDRVSLRTLIAEFYEFKGSASNYGSRIGSAFAEGWRWMVATFVGLVHL